MTALAKRSCGPCTACCTILKIAAPELRKKAHKPCQHLSGAGCGVYQQRPQVCQQFLCGWRLFAELGDDWRPDLSGVMVMRKAPEELPPAYRAAGYGVELAIIGGRAAIERPAFARFVAGLLAKGIAVSMSAASPSTLVNEHLEPGLERDPDALRGKLLALYEMLHAARWGIGMLVPLYRLQLDRQRQKYLSRSNS